MTATKNIIIKKMIPPTITGGPYPLEPRLLTTKQKTTPPKQSSKISKPKFVQANLEKSNKGDLYGSNKHQNQEDENPTIIKGGPYPLKPRLLTTKSKQQCHQNKSN